MKNKRDFVLKVTYKIKSEKKQKDYLEAKGALSHQAYIDKIVTEDIERKKKLKLDFGVVKDQKVEYKNNTLNTENTNYNKSVKMEFSYAIFVIRKSIKENGKSITQEEFANKVDISKHTIMSWESKRQTNPKVNLVIRVLRTLKNHWLKSVDNQEVNDAFMSLQYYVDHQESI